MSDDALNEFVDGLAANFRAKKERERKEREKAEYSDIISDGGMDPRADYEAEREATAKKERSEAIQRILDGTPLYCRPDSEVVFHWGKPGIGFGTATFYYSDHEFGEMKLYCDNETMSKAFIKEMLCQMVDDSVFED